MARSQQLIAMNEVVSDQLGLLGKCLRNSDFEEFPDYLFRQRFVDREAECTDRFAVRSQIALEFQED